jgi:G3E family GTPase
MSEGAPKKEKFNKYLLPNIEVPGEVGEAFHSEDSEIKQTSFEVPADQKFTITEGESFVAEYPELKTQVLRVVGVVENEDGAKTIRVEIGE